MFPPRGGGGMDRTTILILRHSLQRHKARYSGQGDRYSTTPAQPRCPSPTRMLDAPWKAGARVGIGATRAGETRRPGLSILKPKRKHSHALTQSHAQK